MRAPTRALVALAVLAVLLWATSIVSADTAVVLSERWIAAFHEAWDTARDIDANQWGVVVVGTSGVVVYDENGQELAVVVTDDAQHAVRVAERVAYVGGTRGVTAYSLDGELLWSLPLSDGCQALAIVEHQLLILTGGRLATCSLDGAPQGEIPLGFTACAIDSHGNTVAAVGEGHAALLENGSVLWQRTLPFPASDVAIDAWDDVWIVGDHLLARLSHASGEIQWTNRLLGVATAVAATLLPADVSPGAADVKIPGVAVVGYRTCETGHDFMTALVAWDGALLWQAFHSSGHGDDMAYGVTSLPNGDIVVTGVSPFARDSESKDDYLTVCYTIASYEHSAGDGDVTSDPDAVAPTVDFTWEPFSPRAWDRIIFSSLAEAAEGDITSWWWSFDDYYRGVGRTKEHRFLRSGWYDVTLRVENCAGCAATITKSIYIENRPPEADPTARSCVAPGELAADFDWSIQREQRGTYPEGFLTEAATDVDDVHFQDLSTGSSPLMVEFEAGALDWDGSVTHIEWEFGDGARSEEAAPRHTYAAPGTYMVTVRVTDDEGAVTTAALPVAVEASGSIVSWEWDIDGPGSYRQGTSPSSRHPVFGFNDDSSEDSFQVTLTVRDSGGATASATQWIPVANVPPTASFTHAFTGEPILPPADEVFWGGEGNQVMQAPDQPAQSGVVAFTDRCFDGEPWLGISEWLWDFDGGYECQEEAESCHTSGSPYVLFISGGEGGRQLFRGTRLVTLEVWDDDGEASSVVHPVHVANIAPYAGFEWMHDAWWWSNTTPTCTGGDTSKTGSEGPFTVTRDVESWEAGDAVFVPWGWWWTGGQVTLTFTGGGDVVDIEETVPEGWTIEYWGEDLAVIGNSLMGTVSLGEGAAVVQYEISPPRDETATPGTHTIHGSFIARTGGGEEGDPEDEHHVSLDSEVVLCTTVDVETEVEFRAFGDEDTWTGAVDPNGDSVTFAWDFGPHGTQTDQWVWLSVQFQGVQAQYVDWDWMWNGTVPARLTVTDSQGASTSVDASINLEGYCSGGGGE